MTSCTNDVKQQTTNRQASIPESIQEDEHKSEENTGHRVQITIQEQIFIVAIEDSETGRAFLAQLPHTYTLNDLHENEKYTYLSTALPSAPQAVSQIHVGDIMLFGNDCFVLFYKEFSTSYAYTSLGRIDDPEGLVQALGSGSVVVQLDILE